MTDESVILINLLKVKPGKQDALIALLKQNTARSTPLRSPPSGHPPPALRRRSGRKR